jgi:hypothetical protein
LGSTSSLVSLAALFLPPPKTAKYYIENHDYIPSVSHQQGWEVPQLWEQRDWEEKGRNLLSRTVGVPLALCIHAAVIGREVATASRHRQEIDAENPSPMW